jgi:RHS repeat-associated protein
VVQDTSTSTVILNRSHAFSDQVNLTGITESAVSGRNESYVYTANNRLQEGDGAWGTLTWTYDGVGNRTSEVLGSTTSTYSYPSTANTLSSVTQGSTTVRSFSYDGAGNVTADTRSGTTYHYTINNRGRLAELTIGTTVTADYTYDGVERMAIRTTQNMTPAGTTHYVYDAAGRLLVEASGTGTFLREYVWLDDLPLAVVADLETSTPHLYFVHADQLNRPLKMTDGSESIVWDAIYRPFGDVQSITGSGTNNLRFPGQYFLVEEGLHYNWYRHYDPTLGRYVQPDPLGFVGGPSVYGYARLAPNQYIDPDGRCPLCVAIAISAATSASLDILIQLLENRGQVECIDWQRVGIAALIGGTVRLGLGNSLVGRFLADESGALNKPFTPEESQLLRDLFGKNVLGAQNLLDRLAQGQVNLPPGLTQQVLQRYADIAQRYIDAGRDTLGVQALRLQALKQLLK